MYQQYLNEYTYQSALVTPLLYTPPRTPEAMPARSSRPGRTQKSSNIDEDSSKAASNRRGRPRVESQDESAVERRRTQIRLAQRAYRERKETTISVLEARVGHLQQVVREMAKTFADFNDKTVASGVPAMQPMLNEQLRMAMEKFDELNRSGGIEDDCYSIAVPSLDSRHSSVSQHKQSVTPPRHALHTPHYAEPPMIDSRHGIESSQIGMLGYEFDYSNADGQVEESSVNPIQIWNPSWNISQPATNYDLGAQHSPLQGWKFEVPMGMLGVSTYSWQETSFARRLLRHSHERCLFLLTSPTAKVNPSNNRVRYSLSFMTKDALIEKLKRTTNKSNTEPLEDWTMPMLHVGGAGLHYERDPREVEPKPGFTTERNIGPFAIPTAAIPAPAMYYPDKVAEWLGLHGTWFDNRDVEVYLSRKGLNVNEGAERLVVELEDVPDLDSTYGSGSPTNSENSGVSPRIVSPYEEMLVHGIVFPTHTGYKRRRVSVSLDDLISKLNDRCFCLGRAPGYKQSDVDEVLRKVILEADSV